MLMITQGKLVIRAGSKARQLHLLGSDFKLDSPLDAHHTRALKNIDQETAKALSPINTQLHTLASLQAYLDDATAADLPVKDVKAQLQASQPALYLSL